MGVAEDAERVSHAPAGVERFGFPPKIFMVEGRPYLIYFPLRSGFRCSRIAFPQRGKPRENAWLQFRGLIDILCAPTCESTMDTKDGAQEDSSERSMPVRQRKEV